MSADSSRRAQRLAPARRLIHDRDVWVASTSPDRTPSLVPMHFAWDGEARLVGTDLLAGRLL